MVINTALEHPGKTYAYRVEAENVVVVLATDGEYDPSDYPSLEKYRRFYHKADVLIFGAMFSEREVFSRESWDQGHSAPLIGADIAREAKVKRLLLFHSQPFTARGGVMQVLQQTKEYLGKYLDQEGGIPEIIIAQEGMEIPSLVGLTPEVYQVFELAKVADFFATYDNLETALRALGSSDSFYHRPP